MREPTPEEQLKMMLDTINQSRDLQDLSYYELHVLYQKVKNEFWRRDELTRLQKANTAAKTKFPKGGITYTEEDLEKDEHGLYTHAPNYKKVKKDIDELE